MNPIYLTLAINLVGFATASIGLWRVLVELKGARRELDGRMSELLETTRQLAGAQGKAEGKAEEKADAIDEGRSSQVVGGLRRTDPPMKDTPIGESK